MGNEPESDAPPGRASGLSLLVFNFQLSPWEACLNLNVHEKSLFGFAAACTRNQLTLLAHSEALTLGGPAFVHLHNQANTAARRLTDAHALYCNQSQLFSAEPTTWLEIRDAPPGRSTLGYRHVSLASAPLEPEHPHNGPLHSAFTLLERMGQVAGLILALADFRAARREPGAYYAFHAFRVLEDIRDAFPGTERRQRWDEMNKALGTDEQHWEELTRASTSARHLVPEAEACLMDHERHGRLLDLTKAALLRFIEVAQSDRP